MAQHISELVSFLSTVNKSTKRVTSIINASDVILSINQAIPCTLVLSELISNTFKHAFPGSRKGNINIDFHPDGNNRLILYVSDDGVGFPEDIDISDSKTLGLRLISTLVAQLKGAIEIEGAGGAIFKIKFAP